MIPKDELSAKIRQLAGERKGLGEIAAALERSEGRIRQLSGEKGIPIYDVSRRGKYNTTKTTKSPEAVAREIDELLREGMITSREELADRVGVSPKCVGEYGVELPSTLKPYRWRPELDEQIDAGESLPAMADAEKISWQAIHQYIQKSGQLAFWHQKREEKRAREGEYFDPEKRQTLEELAGQISSLIERNVKTAGWAEQMALAFRQQWRNSVGVHNLTSEELLRIFRVYDEAHQQGEKVTGRELASRASVGDTTFGYVCRRMGLSNIHQGKIVLTGEQKAVIERALALEMTAVDVGYFADLPALPAYIIQQRRARQGIHCRVRPIIFTLNPPTFLRNLTYRLASQVYEAVDLGFTGKETQQLLSTPERMLHPKVLEYALQHRLEIEPTIIHALDTMFPEEKHEKPYR